jgi:lactoylglutathione lyase
MTAGFSAPFPIFTVPSAARSAEFYTRAFGFVQTYRWPADEARVADFIVLELDGREIGFGTGAGGVAGAEMCFQVEDMAAAWQTALDAGATSIAAPQGQPWGESMARLSGPDGIPIQLFCRV